MDDFTENDKENRIKIEYIEPIVSPVVEEKFRRTRIVTEIEFGLTEGYTFESDVKFEDTRPSKQEPELRRTNRMGALSQNYTDGGLRSNLKNKTKNSSVVQPSLSNGQHFKCERNSLSEHINVHANNVVTDREKMYRNYVFPPPPFTCDVCGYKTDDRTRLKCHIMRHAGIRNFTCQHCPKRFYVNSELTDHIRTHTGVKPYICDMCSHAFAIRTNLVAHIRLHMRKKNAKPAPTYECYLCGDGVKYQRKSYLEIHMRQYHVGGGIFRCNVCAKQFLYKNGLTRHLTVHNAVQKKEVTTKESSSTSAKNDNAPIKRFKCDLCEYASKYSSHLKTHARKHTGDKPYKCNICPKAYVSSSHLKRHERSIHADKFIKCTECTKKFSDKSELNLHVRIVHRGFDVPKRFKCKICPIRTTSKSNMLKHLRIHTGEKPFHCPHCGTAFNSKTNMERHAKMVRCSTKFRCDICSKMFQKRKSIESHMRLHISGKLAGCEKKVTNEKRRAKALQCSQCPFKSSSDRTLMDHYKRVHCISMDCLLKIRKISSIDFSLTPTL